MNPERFLDRIARGLGRPRQRVPPARAAAGVPEFHAAAPLGAGAGADLAQRFALELAAVGGRLVRARGPAEAAAALAEVLRELSAAGRAVSFGRAAFAGLPVEFLWDEFAAVPWEGGDDAAAAEFRAASAAAWAGVTTADFGIAGTGTLVIAGGTDRPRAASLLPAHHVALLDVARIVPRLGLAYEVIAARGAPPSSVIAITGPSRTSDIENDLTIGVHGPAAVTVIAYSEGRA